MNTTTNTSTTASPGTPMQDDRVSQHLQAMAEEAEAILKATARISDQKFDAARERLRHELSQLRSRLTDLESDSAEQWRNTARQADASVHAHPYGAMGAAAVTGLLLGFLFGRR